MMFSKNGVKVTKIKLHFYLKKGGEKDRKINIRAAKFSRKEPQLDL